MPASFDPPLRAIASLMLMVAVWATADRPTAAADARQPLTLWYTRPAGKWVEALPVGNGRLGAMVFGGLETEQIQFNEDTLWTGQPHEYHRPGAVKFLPEIRKLLADGKQREAERLAMQEFMSDPLRQKAYQPFGDLWLSFPGHAKATDYRRELDLDAALVTVGYRVGDVQFKREVFCTYPYQALVVRISADRPGQVAFSAKLTSPHRSAQTRAIGNHQLAVAGAVEEGGLKFEARMVILTDGGKVIVDDQEARVAGANAATLRLSAATSFVNFRDISADPAQRCAKLLTAAGVESYENLLSAHQEDYRRLFRRVSLDLGRGGAAAELPTDERLKAHAQQDDPALAALYFQFGRYLLIASSRPGCQPANLQGIWNDQLKPPWDSKWTTNINTEMNYWPAEVTNLPECHLPLFDLIDDCVQSGRKTAEAHYGCRGWVLHHNADLWRGTAPINAANHGIWVTGGAWLCQHLWEHYRFTGDREFLAKRAYPAMKEASLFFVDFLVKDPKSGWLISTPSNSPEQGGLVAGPTMDHQIIRALLGNTIEAARILGVDADFAAQLAGLRKQIAPNQVGRHGQLQEWLEDKDDPKNTHRHVSHLWGLFPGDEITPDRPELFAAARQSLVFRGDGGTGWSKAWKVNLWARLADGDHAQQMLSELLARSTLPNLFDTHPPFQIDGNFGGASGMAEMLLQSHTGEIHLLPALPKAWPSGSVRGLCARGGFEVDIDWQDGKLVTAVLHSKLGNRCTLRYGKTTASFDTKAGQRLVLSGQLVPR